MIPWKITNKINIARSNSNLSNTLCKANENSFFLFTEVSLWVIKKLNSINQYPFHSSSFNLDLYYDKNCTKEIFEAQNLKSITSPTLIYGKISTTSLDPIWFGQKILSFKFQYTG